MSKEKIWQKRNFSRENFDQLSVNNSSFPNVFLKLLSIRQLTNKSLESFLTPSLKNLRDPNNFIDMEKAAKRVVDAIVKKETIGVFGDYDVDGVCSSALLMDFFSSIDASYTATLPNRLKEGYGLSKAGIDRLVEQNSKLIIAVDCGTSSFEEIDYANSLGLDVIVIDHHNASSTLPRAFAIINPKREDCPSDAKILCAAGVAFYFCISVRRFLREQKYFFGNEPDLKNLLDLVALATVCDVVPLILENRVFVKQGLMLIKQSCRLGIKHLLDICNIDINKISSTNLGFHLGPRINAAGRLEDATVALNLMTTKQKEKASSLAQVLHEHNSQRQEIEKQTVEDACTMIDNDEDLSSSPILVLHDESWHPGVVGIVASRITEKYHKPSIIIGKNGKGSGRSISGIDLHAMVSQVSFHLAGFGGHAHAIGVTLASNVDSFRKDLAKILKDNVDEKIFEKIIFYDDEILLNEFNFDFLHLLKKLEPFGSHNHCPIFRINNCHVRNLRNLTGGHIKGELENAYGYIEFIGFRMSMDDSLVNKKIDVLGCLEENSWQNRTSLQFRIIDYKEAN